MVNWILTKTIKEPEVKKIGGGNQLLSFQVEKFEFQEEKKGWGWKAVKKDAIELNKISFQVSSQISWKGKRELLKIFEEAEVGQKFELDTNNIEKNTKKVSFLKSEIESITVLDFNKLEKQKVNVFKDFVNKLTNSVKDAKEQKAAAEAAAKKAAADKAQKEAEARKKKEAEEKAARPPIKIKLTKTDGSAESKNYLKAGGFTYRLVGYTYYKVGFIETNAKDKDRYSQINFLALQVDELDKEIDFLSELDLGEEFIIQFKEEDFLGVNDVKSLKTKDKVKILSLNQEEETLEIRKENDEEKAAADKAAAKAALEENLKPKPVSPDTTPQGTTGAPKGAPNLNPPKGAPKATPPEGPEEGNINKYWKDRQGADGKINGQTKEQVLGNDWLATILKAPLMKRAGEVKRLKDLIDKAQGTTGAPKGAPNLNPPKGAPKATPPTGTIESPKPVETKPATTSKPKPKPAAKGDISVSFTIKKLQKITKKGESSLLPKSAKINGLTKAEVLGENWQTDLKGKATHGEINTEKERLINLIRGELGEPAAGPEEIWEAELDEVRNNAVEEVDHYWNSNCQSEFIYFSFKEKAGWEEKKVDYIALSPKLSDAIEKVEKYQDQQFVIKFNFDGTEDGEAWIIGHSMIGGAKNILFLNKFEFTTSEIEVSAFDKALPKVKIEITNIRNCLKKYSCTKEGLNQRGWLNKNWANGVDWEEHLVNNEDNKGGILSALTDLLIDEWIQAGKKKGVSKGKLIEIVENIQKYLEKYENEDSVKKVFENRREDIEAILEKLNKEDEVLENNTPDEAVEQNLGEVPIEVGEPEYVPQVLPKLPEVWTNISPDFADNDLVDQWTGRGFTHTQAKDWVNGGLAVREVGFAAWLKDEIRFTAEEVLNDLSEADFLNLRAEYETHIGGDPLTAARAAAVAAVNNHWNNRCTPTDTINGRTKFQVLGSNNWQATLQGKVTVILVNNERDRLIGLINAEVNAAVAIAHTILTNALAANSNTLVQQQTKLTALNGHRTTYAAGTATVAQTAAWNTENANITAEINRLTGLINAYNAVNAHWNNHQGTDGKINGRTKLQVFNMNWENTLLGKTTVPDVNAEQARLIGLINDEKAKETPLPKTFAQKLAETKTIHADDPYKKIWDDIKVKRSEKAFNEVLNLVELIKKAYAKTDPADTKTKLEAFKDAVANTWRYKAWKIIEKDAYKKDSKRLGTGALENLTPSKTPAQLLAEAKATAKTKITSAGEEAYTHTHTPWLLIL